MSKPTFKVGQKVYAVKEGGKHAHGFTESMRPFADGKVGVIESNYKDSYSVRVEGVSIAYSYDATELRETPRGTQPVVFKPLKEKPTTGRSVKPVDKRQKTLYAVVKNGTPIYSSTKRADAREVKAIHGGLKAGVTIVAYKAVNEIR